MRSWRQTILETEKLRGGKKWVDERRRFNKRLHQLRGGDIRINLDRKGQIARAKDIISSRFSDGIEEMYLEIKENDVINLKIFIPLDVTEEIFDIVGSTEKIFDFLGSLGKPVKSFRIFNESQRQYNAIPEAMINALVPLRLQKLDLNPFIGLISVKGVEKLHTIEVLALPDIQPTFPSSMEEMVSLSAVVFNDDENQLLVLNPLLDLFRSRDNYTPLRFYHTSAEFRANVKIAFQNQSDIYVAEFQDRIFLEKRDDDEQKEDDVSNKCCCVTGTGRPCSRNATTGSKYCTQHKKAIASNDGKCSKKQTAVPWC